MLSEADTRGGGVRKPPQPIMNKLMQPYDMDLTILVIIATKRSATILTFFSKPLKPVEQTGNHLAREFAVLPVKVVVLKQLFYL